MVSDKFTWGEGDLRTVSEGRSFNPYASFNQVTGVAVVQEQGIYEEGNVFVFPALGRVMVEASAGLVHIRADGTTSRMKTLLILLRTDLPIYIDRHSILCYEGGPGRRPLGEVDRFIYERI